MRKLSLPSSFFSRRISESEEENRKLTEGLNAKLTKLDNPADSAKRDSEKAKINAGAIKEYHAFVIEEFNKLGSEFTSSQEQNNEKTLTLIKNLEEEKLKTFLDNQNISEKKTLVEALYNLDANLYPVTKIVGPNARLSRKTPGLDGVEPKIQTGYQLIKSKTLEELSKDQNSEFIKTLVKTLKFDESDINNFLTQKENTDFSDAEIAKKHLEKAFILAKLKINLDEYPEQEQQSSNCFACCRPYKVKEASSQSNLSSLIEKKLEAEMAGFSQSETENHSQREYYLDNKYLAFIDAKFNEIAQKQDSNEILKFESAIDYIESKHEYSNGSRLIKHKALEIIFDETTNPEFKKTLENSIIFNHENINDFITNGGNPDSIKRKALEIIFDETTNPEFKKTLENSIIFNHKDIDDFLIRNDHDLIRSKTLEIIFDETTNPEFKKTLENSIIFNHKDIDDFLNRKTDTITSNSEKISEKEKLLQELIERTDSDSSLHSLITSPEMTNEIFKRNLQPRFGKINEIEINETQLPSIISTVDNAILPIEISAVPIIASLEFFPRIDLPAGFTQDGVEFTQSLFHSIEPVVVRALSNYGGPYHPRRQATPQTQHGPDITPFEEDNASQNHEPLVASKALIFKPILVATHQRPAPIEPQPDSLRQPGRSIRSISATEDTPSKPASSSR